MKIHSLVIPVFNEAQGIESLYARVQKILNTMKETWEVILVDDGSQDRTSEILDELNQRDSRFKVVHLSRNFGHQIAVSAGIEYAQGETVTIIDADLQDPPELIPRFLEKWGEGFDVVYGVRASRNGETVFKRATARVFYRLIHRLTRLDIPVDTGDFRLMDRKVVNALLSLPEQHRYLRGLVSWVGFKQTGITYDRASRESGETHYPLTKMVKLALDAVASFSFVPLRLATLIGFLSSLGAMVGIIWTLYTKFVAARAIHGWTSTILVVLFLGGTQLFCIGLMGEYIGRTFDEARRRPLYIVSRIIGLSRPEVSKTAGGTGQRVA